MQLPDDVRNAQERERRAQRAEAPIAAGLDPETGTRYRTKTKQTFRRRTGGNVHVCPGYCQCGCGGRPKQARSRFLPGHDSRMARH